MKTIGLLGGMSWESTAVYYQHLNRMTRARLGGLHSAPLLLWSADFAQIAAWQAAGDWDRAGAALGDAARRLDVAGADLLILCTNTMHKLAEAIETAASIPLLHIADATARALKTAGAARPLLLATRYTMEQDFYVGRLRNRHGLDMRIPDDSGRRIVHDIIYDELCQGVIREASRARILDVIAATPEADSIILGCTEIGLLIDASHTDRPVFDTTEIHARAAIDAALAP